MTPIYFSGSISGGRDDVGLYRRIVAAFERDGFEVFAGLVTSAEVGAGGESLAPEAIFARDLGWLEEVTARGGAIVAEVTLPSHGVGYEIAAARYRFAIPVVALFRPASGRRCSAMVAGDPGVVLLEYAEGELDALPGRVAAALRSLGAAPRRSEKRVQ
ncbi:MAG TPA: hypothetical protein VMS56_05965 [Thermoanaerobaculia bacterium]|nr:hypothetical protein [Thermoanaerobaculia bacterium]